MSYLKKIRQKRADYVSPFQERSSPNGTSRRGASRPSRLMQAWAWGLLLALVGCQVPWLSPEAAPAKANFVKFYGGLAPDTLMDLAVASDGYYLLGTGYASGKSEVNLIQVDLAGNERRWVRWSPPGEGQAQAVFLLDLPNNTYLVGANAVDSSGRRQAWLLIYDAALTLLDTLSYREGAAGFAWLTTAALTEDGILVAGYSSEVDSLKFQEGSRTPATDLSDGWLWQLDRDLQPRWERRYGFTRADRCVALANDGSETYALLATQYPASDPRSAWSLLRLSASGYLLDQWTVSREAERPVDLVQGPSGQRWVLTQNDAQQLRLYVHETSTSLPQLAHTDSTLYQPADLALAPDGSLWVSALRASGRQVLTGQFDAAGRPLQVPATTSGAAAVDLPQRPGPLRLLDDGHLLMGATINWSNDNRMMALMRGPAAGLLPQ